MKVTITLEDKPNGKVGIISDPSFEDMAMKINSGQQATSAEGYALRMLREARVVSKEAVTNILIPRIGH